MAALMALPEAFFFISAPLNGAVSTPTLRSMYSLATEMHWLSRLRRARMYIGVGTLFCVTLPALIRYGIGVRMWAPSMPLPSEPSTRLSRVVPHEACFCTSTSGMPYLAKKPLSLATNSGPASVSAMKPSFALVISGPPAAAPCTPARKLVFTAARSAAVPPLALRKLRRLGRALVSIVTVRPFVFDSGWADFSAPVRASLPWPTKKPRPKAGGLPRDSGVAARPTIGPSDAVVTAPSILPVTSFVPDPDLSGIINGISALYGND